MFKSISSQDQRGGRVELTFAPGSSWTTAYQRNNKNKGQKNLRCFPACCVQGHQSGFCGRTVQVDFRFTAAAAHSASSLEHDLPSPNLAGKLMSFSQFMTADTPGFALGEVVGATHYQDHLRTSSSQLGGYIEGEVLDSETLPAATAAAATATASAAAADASDVQIRFEFNTALKGWHYGFMGSKKTRNLHHRVCVYVCHVVVSGGVNGGAVTGYRVLAKMFSPAWQIFCRRRKSAPEPKCLPAPGTTLEVAGEIVSPVELACIDRQDHEHRRANNAADASSTRGQAVSQAQQGARSGALFSVCTHSGDGGGDRDGMINNRGKPVRSPLSTNNRRQRSRSLEYFGYSPGRQSSNNEYPTGGGDGGNRSSSSFAASNSQMRHTAAAGLSSSSCRPVVQRQTKKHEAERAPLSDIANSGTFFRDRMGRAAAAAAASPNKGRAAVLQRRRKGVVGREGGGLVVQATSSPRNATIKRRSSACELTSPRTSTRFAMDCVSSSTTTTRVRPNGFANAVDSPTQHHVVSNPSFVFPSPSASGLRKHLGGLYYATDNAAFASSTDWASQVEDSALPRPPALVTVAASSSLYSEPASAMMMNPMSHSRHDNRFELLRHMLRATNIAALQTTTGSDEQNDEQQAASSVAVPPGATMNNNNIMSGGEARASVTCNAQDQGVFRSRLFALLKHCAELTEATNNHGSGGVTDTNNSGASDAASKQLGTRRWALPMHVTLYLETNPCDSLTEFALHLAQSASFERNLCLLGNDHLHGASPSVAAAKVVTMVDGVNEAENGASSSSNNDNTTSDDAVVRQALVLLVDEFQQFRENQSRQVAATAATAAAATATQRALSPGGGPWRKKCPPDLQIATEPTLLLHDDEMGGIGLDDSALTMHALGGPSLDLVTPRSVVGHDGSRDVFAFTPPEQRRKSGQSGVVGEEGARFLPSTGFTPAALRAGVRMNHQEPNHATSLAGNTNTVPSPFGAAARSPVHHQHQHHVHQRTLSNSSFFFQVSSPFGGSSDGGGGFAGELPSPRMPQLLSMEKLPAAGPHAAHASSSSSGKEEWRDEKDFEFDFDSFIPSHFGRMSLDRQ